tara:strand:- start:421 stop:807 length:387 start_codon:yes stop_codon:yes gene_type:complete
MNPQLNKVFSKIAKAENKTELKSEKVELNIMQDFNNALDSLIEGNADGNRAKNEAKSIIQKAIKDYEMVTPRIGRAIKSSMELEKAAKDLGLDLPGKYGSAKDRLYDEEKRNKEAIKKLQSIKGDLNF